MSQLLQILLLWTWTYIFTIIVSQVYTPEKSMAPYSSTLAWKIPWMQEPGRLQTMGSLRGRHDWVTSLSLFTFMHWRRKWQPTPVFLRGESQGRGSLVGLPSTGSHRVTHDWSDLAAAAGIYPKMGLLAHMLILFLVLQVIVTLFSIVTA